MIFLDDERVTITDPSDRWYGETGYVDDWYIGTDRKALVSRQVGRSGGSGAVH